MPAPPTPATGPRAGAASGRRAPAASHRARLVVVAVLAVVASPASGAVALASGPPNDALRAARAVPLGGLVEMDTAGATLQSDEPMPACRPRSGATVWFTFTPTDPGRYAADTFESGYDTVVAVYRGRWLGALRPVACSDDAGGPTSYAIFKGEAGVTYRVQIAGERGATGPLVLSMGYGPDLTPPLLTAPVSTLRTGVRLGAADVTQWTGRDNQSGVARYELQVAVGDGRFRPVELDPRDVPLSRHRVADRETTRFRVRGWNHQGMASPWLVGPAFVPRLVQDGARAIRYAGEWHTRETRTASGGSTRWSTEAGATATFTFTGRTIAIVAPRSPARGAVRILVDGRPAETVDLRAPELRPRGVVFVRTFPDAERHTISLEVVGTPGRPRVDLDAIEVHAPPPARGA